MRFSPQFLDDLRARLPVSEVVRQRVQLKKAGREWKGLSPFNKERTPSFFVNDDKAMWFDFSSGQNGTIFDFVMRTEGLSFPEAVERLARDVGMEVPRPTPEARAADEARAGLHELMESAAQWFQSQLRTAAGGRALAYLRARGLDDASIRRFRLGFAPDHRAMLKQALEARGFGRAKQLEAGVLVAPEGGGEPYDRFRDRIVFPIGDRRGRVIAFGARAMADVKPKYLNSPDTPLFHKGATLYNFSEARKAAHEAAAIIVAEGYMDVIALTRAGLAHAVAPLGTALTETQIELLWKTCAEPILCFDGDKAGRWAAHRAAERALPLLKAGYSLRFVELPPGEDPDSLLQARGAAALRQLFENTTPLDELLWRRALEGRPLDTPERRAKFRKDLRELARLPGDPIVREHYEREFDVRFQQLFPDPRRRTRDKGWEKRPSAYNAGLLGSPAQLNAGVANARNREQEILSILLRFPPLADELLEELISLHFQAPDLDRLRGAILEVVGSGSGLDLGRLRHDFTDGSLSNLIDRLAGPKGPGFRALRPGVTLDQARVVLEDAIASHRLAELENEMREATANAEREPSEANHARIVALLAELERARNAASREAGAEDLRM